MSDIFLSYDSEDRDRVAPLVRALDAQGWSVFWDYTIRPGETWARVIGSELESAAVVVVVWSRASLDSDYVHAEAEEGRKSGRLVPVRIDAVEPRFPFSQIHAATLEDWDGSDTAHGGLRELLEALRAKLAPPASTADRILGDQLRELTAVSREQQARLEQLEQDNAALREQQAATPPAAATAPVAGGVGVRYRLVLWGLLAGLFLGLLAGTLDWLPWGAGDRAALEKQLAETRQHLEAAEARVRELELALADAERTRARLEALEREHAQAVADRDRRIAELERELEARGGARAPVRSWVRAFGHAGIEIRFGGDTARPPRVRIIAGDRAEPVAFAINADVLTVRNVSGRSGSEVAAAWVRWRTGNDASGFDVMALGDGSGEVPHTVNRGEVLEPRDETAATGGRDQRLPIEPEMVELPGGCFQMGSTSNGEPPDERPAHEVCVKPFRIARFETTLAGYREFVAAAGLAARGCRHHDRERGRWQADDDRSWSDPGFPQTNTHPVVCVSFDEVRLYLDWLGATTGKRYRLPTEAEWEYAARAGTRSLRFWGDDPNLACGHGNVADRALRETLAGGPLQIHGCRDGFTYTAPVEAHVPNGFGLHQMLGNVWEWVEDCWHDSYDAAPADGVAWLSAGGGDCSRRVLRGGSWNAGPRYVRSANRDRLQRAFRNIYVGFRVALDIP